MRGSQMERTLLALPGVGVVLFGFFVPIMLVLSLSVWAPGPDGAPTLGLGNFSFLGDQYYWSVMLRTLRVSLAVTVACTVLGVPFAYLAARSRPRRQLWLMVLVLMPLMISVVVRTFGWLVLLGRNGPVAKLLYELGITSSTNGLLYTETGLVIALSQVLLPFMVLVLIGVINGIDPVLEEASRTMGAGFYATLRHVVLPLSMPGLLAGSTIVFVLSISAFVTPSLIGGVRLPVLATTIYSKVFATMEWGVAAAQAAFLLVFVTLLLMFYSRLLARRHG